MSVALRISTVVMLGAGGTLHRGSRLVRLGARMDLAQARASCVRSRLPPLGAHGRSGVADPARHLFRRRGSVRLAHRQCRAHDGLGRLRAARSDPGQLDHPRRADQQPSSAGSRKGSSRRTPKTSAGAGGAFTSSARFWRSLHSLSSSTLLRKLESGRDAAIKDLGCSRSRRSPPTTGSASPNCDFNLLRSEGGSQPRASTGNSDGLFAGVFRVSDLVRVSRTLRGCVARRRACPRVPASPKMPPSRPREVPSLAIPGNTRCPFCRALRQAL